MSTENRGRDGTVISGYRYTYDNRNRITGETVTDKDGESVRTYEYNLAGELARYEEQGGQTQTVIRYAFDVFGNKVRESLSKTGTAEVVTEYLYNEKTGRLYEKRSGGKTAASYTYDADGNLIAVKEDGKTTEYTYTQNNKLATTTVNGRLESSVFYDGTGMKAFELLRKEYRYSSSGEEKIEIVEENTTRRVTERYAAAEPAEQESGTGQAELREGTWERQSQREAVEADRQTAMGYYALTQVPVVFFASFAPPLIWELQRAAEDFWRELLSSLEQVKDVWYTVFKADTQPSEQSLPSNEEPVSDEPMLTEQRAKYLSGKKYTEILDSTDGTSGTASYLEPTRYLYDMTQENAQVLAEYGNADTPRTVYAYAASGRVTSEQKGAVGYYLYDGRGSVSETVENARITASYRYDPYGNMTKGETGQSPVYAYNAEQYIPQTGLQYLRARNYDPKTGRFTTKDS